MQLLQVAEKEAKLKQSEEELYARHKEMKDQLERTRADLEEKSEFIIIVTITANVCWYAVTFFAERRLESGRPLTPPQAKKKGVFARN